MSTSCLRPVVRRCFSTAAALEKAKSTQQQYHRPTDAGRSSRRRPVEQDISKIPAAQIPYDLGLFSGTFIMPTGSAKPSFLTKTGLRTRLEWYRFRQRIRDHIQLLLGWKRLHLWRRYWQKRNGFRDKRPKLRSWQIVEKALTMHASMYEAVVGNAGSNLSRQAVDIKQVKDLCSEGLRNQLVKVIEHRPQNQLVRWERRGVWPHVTTRVVSDRASAIPREDSVVRQAVVKIQSQQRIKCTNLLPDGARKSIDESAEWKNITEYLVITKRIIDNKEEDWKIWGTAKETSCGDIFDHETEFLESRGAVTT